MLGKAGFAAEGWTWSFTFGRLIVRMAGWTGVSSGVHARERVPGKVSFRELSRRCLQVRGRRQEAGGRRFKRTVMGAALA
eukprot:312902-Chlamydomonas_euryale.AAC.1